MAAREIRDCGGEDEKGDVVVNSNDGVVLTGTLLDG